MKPLHALAHDLAAGATTSRALTEQALARIADPDGEGPRTFTRVFREAALATAEASDRLRASGVVPSPLAGIPVSVKDLCDVAGFPTCAGSVVLKQDLPAAEDATAVARLRAAGAVIVGTTNMTEIALGGLGLNPHYGDCRNPYDRATGRIPGGSSSGAAVSVADGMAAAGLGTDTAGSVRIPAGLCGLAGFKPTAARVPTDGIFPLSWTLDSIGPLARTVACCALVDAVFAGEPPAVPDPTRLAGLRLAVPQTLVTEDLEPAVADAFARALSKLSAAGARIEEIPLAELGAIAAASRALPISTVEAYAIHRERLGREGVRARIDPRILDRLLIGEKVSAAAFIQAGRHRAALQARVGRITRDFDAVVMPTLAITAPPIADYQGSEARLREPAAILIRNTSIANFLDRCALTIPCHDAGAAPVGFMLVGERLADHRLLAIGMAVEPIIAPPPHDGV